MLNLVFLPNPLQIDRGSDVSGVHDIMVKTVCLASHFMLNSKLTPSSAVSKSSRMFEFSSLSSPSGSALLQHIPDSSRTESQPSVSLKVIPDVDPHRAVETTDNHPKDDYSGLMEDGLGHDDDFIDDDEHHDVGVTNTGSQERFALPPWLADAFKARLEEANSRGGDGLPKLYSVQKTFWFPQQSSYFLLRRTSLSPQDLYNPHFFLWDPECLLVEGIGCLKCGVKLHHHGYAS